MASANLAGVPRLLLASVVTAVLALPAVAGAAPTMAVSDQNAQTFSDPLFAAVKSRAARYIAPYDVVSDPAQNAALSEWVDAARAARQRILISFEHSRKSRRAAAKAPSAAAYRKAMTAFRAEYGSRVQEISPWNEVNRKFVASRGEGQPIWNRPDLAATYYGVARKVFAGKTIVALDILDGNNVNSAVSYVRRFKVALKKQRLPSPAIWGIHPYSDINRFSTARTKKLLRETGRGRVWLTEASGIVKLLPRFPTSEKRAAQADRCMFTIAKLDKRIQRLYYYGWYGRPGDPFDSGLVDMTTDVPRLGYQVVVKRQAGACKKPR